MKNRFNLIDEPWIPVVNVGNVSLKQLFIHSEYRALGGNPVQKIALTKLLLAIAQAAYTPNDDTDWAKLSAAGMAQKCLDYLGQWYDRFWLYGEEPFLQMPPIAVAQKQSYGAVLPEISTGNTTVLLDSQKERQLSDAEKALLIVCLMGFGLGGKKTDNSAVLTPGYQGKFNEKNKPSTGKPGTSVSYFGLLHNFLSGENLQQTLWLNLFTSNQLQQIAIYPDGLGIAPWENMPKGEGCEAARSLQRSLMGRLIPFSRFCLLAEDGLHYSEGIQHPGYKEGVVDPTVSVSFSDKNNKVIWCDPEKRPWRYLTALLSFISSGGNENFDCYQIRYGLARARDCIEKIGIWSGGMRVSGNAGEQFLSGSDDFVESQIILKTNSLGEVWYQALVSEMNGLNQLSKVIYSATMGFFKDQQSDGKKQAEKSSSLYWQLCEHYFHPLVNACGDAAQVKEIRKKIAACVDKAYNTFCARGTARQFEAWAGNRPKLNSYLN